MSLFQHLHFYFIFGGMSLIRQHAAFLFIFLLSAVLRFIPLFDYQFTFDELSGLDRTQFGSFSELMERGVRIDAHPALVQIIIYYLVQAFGYVTWVIKLPFLLMGQALIWYAYLFGWKNFSKQAGLTAAAFFAFSLLFVFYAPVARMYISGAFFSVGLLYHFYAICFRQAGHWKHYLMFGLFAWLCALNHHMSALFAFSLCFVGLFYQDGKRMAPYLVTCGLTVILYLPHLPVTLYQLSIPGIGADAGGWLTMPDFTDGFEFVRTLLGTGINWVLVATLLVCGVFFGDHRQSAAAAPYPGPRSLLLWLFIGNFLVIYFYSVFRSPIFQYSVMLFAGSAFILWLCSWLDTGHRILNNIMLVVLSGSLLWQTYQRKDYLHNAVKTVYEYQFERTLHYKQQFGDGNVYPIFFDCDTLMRKIYFNKYNSRFDFKMGADTALSFGRRMYYGNTSSLVLFSRFLHRLPCDFLAATSVPPLFQELITEEFPYLVENTQTQAIDYKLYSRRPSRQAPPDGVVFNCEVPQPCGMEFPDAMPLHADTTNEFPYTVRLHYRLAAKAEGQSVLVKSRVRLHAAPSRNVELVMNTADMVTQANYMYSAKNMDDFEMKSDSTLTLMADQFAGTLYPSIKHRSRLSAYIWNRGKQEFDVLSFSVKTVDYWPLKWHWWD